MIGALRVYISCVDVVTEIMAVLKANGYGHGSVPLAKYLEAHGFRHFAVATGQEGEEMRKAGVRGNIHVLGIKTITLEMPAFSSKWVIIAQIGGDILMEYFFLFLHENDYSEYSLEVPQRDAFIK